MNEASEPAESSPAPPTPAEPLPIEERVRAADLQLQRALEALANAKPQLPKSEAVLLKELEVAAARYKTDKEAEIELQKLGLEERIKNLDIKAAYAVEELKSATTRAVAAETAVEQVRAGATRTTAIWSAASAIVAAGLVFIAKMAGSPGPDAKGGDAGPAASEKPGAAEPSPSNQPPPIVDPPVSGVVAADIYAKLNPILSKLTWPKTDAESVVNVWLLRKTIPEYPSSTKGELKTFSCMTQGKTELCGVLTQAVLQDLRAALPDDVSAIDIRLTVNNGGIYGGIIQNQTTWYSWIRHD